MHIIDSKLGSEGSIQIDLTAGVISLKMDEKTAGLQGGLNVSIPLTYFMDAMAAKINSPVATSVIKLLENLVVGMP